MRGIEGVKWAKYILLKGKIASKTDKSRGKTKGHKGKRNNLRRRGGAQPCVPSSTTMHLPPWAVVNTTGYPWWLPPGHAFPLLERCVWCMSGPCALPMLGHFGPLLLSSLKSSRPLKTSSNYMLWACKGKICKNTQNK